MNYPICPNCFCETASSVCPNCGYDQSNTNMNFDRSAIAPMNILKGRYLLGRILGRGRFGITYIAKDLFNNETVAIKEYMPESYAQRADNLSVNPISEETEYAFEYCKRNFREEIDTLYKLKDNTFVVDVRDYFGENNTEYLVMEYIDGVTIKTFTNSKSDRLSCSVALLIIMTIGSALMEVHKKGFIHRDISLENIMMATNSSIKLIDFGASTNYLEKNTMSNESIFLKPGFTPPEQYDINSSQGSWTDIYALGATFYASVTDQPLVPADKREKNDTLTPLKYLNCGIPDLVSDSIEVAMRLDCRYRYQNMNEFLDTLAPAFAINETQLESKTISLIKSKRQMLRNPGSSRMLSSTPAERQASVFPFRKISLSQSAGI
ncbi:MAG: serine/threonine protein kinase [Clostridiales bacterium]|nr:serine/threonine protein kinase [Clostridiales bacterium]